MYHVVSGLINGNNAASSITTGFINYAVKTLEATSWLYDLQIRISFSYH